MLPRRITVAFVAIAFFLAQPSIAEDEPTPVWTYWHRVELIQPGRHVTVKRFRGLGPKVKGSLISALPESIIVETKAGQITVAKSEVREVRARRSKMRRAHWIGLVAGFALVALLTSGESDFQQPSAAFAYGAMGAGLGYLAGLGVRAVGQNALVYRAPKKTTRN